MKNQRKNPSNQSDQSNRKPGHAGQAFRNAGSKQPGGLPQEQRNDLDDPKKTNKRGTSDFSQESSLNSTLHHEKPKSVQPQMNDALDREPVDAASLYEDNDAHENSSADLDLEDEDSALRRS